MKRIQDLEVCKNKQDPLWCDKHVHDKCFCFNVVSYLNIMGKGNIIKKICYTFFSLPLWRAKFQLHKLWTTTWRRRRATTSNYSRKNEKPRCKIKPGWLLHTFCFFCLNSPLGEIKYLRNPNSYQHRLRMLTHCNCSSLQIEKLEKSNENLKLSRKKIQEAHAKVWIITKKNFLQGSIKLSHISFSEKASHFSQSTILLDEAKIREDARNVQHKSLEKGHAVLKEENKTVRQLVVTIFCWSWRT